MAQVCNDTKPYNDLRPFNWPYLPPASSGASVATSTAGQQIIPQKKPISALIVA